MLGNDLIEFQQMKRYQESLLGEAERIRYLEEARRASTRPRTEQGFARRARPGRTNAASHRSPARVLRSAAARVGSALVLVGSYLEGLDRCQLGKG